MDGLLDMTGLSPSSVYRKWDSWDFCLPLLQSLLAVVASTVPRNSLFPHYLGDSHSDSSEVTLSCGLTCISQMIGGVELCSLDLLAIRMSSLEQHIFKSFAHSLEWFFDLLCVSCSWMLTLVRYMVCR